MLGVATIDVIGAMSARGGAYIEEAEADVLTYLDFPMVPGGAYAPTTHRSANRGWSRSFRATSPCCAR